MAEVVTFPTSDKEAIYRTKEILCDFSDKIRMMMLDEKDPEKLEHLKSIYDMIPVGQFVIGYAMGSKVK